MSDGGSRQKPVRYGVIPAGGLGTRFLPISRTVPKELLPIIDTPVIELVVAEMAAAGITRVVIVNAPGKESLDAYFRPNERLERRLAVEFRKEDIDLSSGPSAWRPSASSCSRKPRGTATLSCRRALSSARSPSRCSGGTTSSSARPRPWRS